jgi:hypothetical protein
MRGTDSGVGDATRQSYPKTSSGDAMNEDEDKQESMKVQSDRAMGGAAMSDSGMGPTGSGRMYPKGKSILKDGAAYRPGAPTDLYVGGVNPATGRDEDEGMPSRRKAGEY